MKVQKLLWILAGILLLIIVLEGPVKEEEEYLEDGTYRNVYIIGLKEEKMEVLLAGKRWTIVCPVGKDVQKENEIADISVKNQEIHSITWKEGTIADQIISIDCVRRKAVLKQYGSLSLSSDWKAYENDAGKIRQMKEGGSLINWDVVQVTAIDGVIQAVVAQKRPDTKIIKVLIHGEKEGIYHREVRLTASTPFEVLVGDEKVTYQAGQEFTLGKEESKEEKKRYEITCPSGRIRILSMGKDSGYPEYRGTMIVEATKEGYLLKNHLKLEEYLYSVVSSEMPSSYPMTALKAQAVCARTYALYQMERSYYSSYGANVDDTVNSQVYNKVAETKKSRQAVRQTQEQYLEADHEPIAAYFYSTSCGSTSDSNDVWMGEESQPSYLSGKMQGTNQKQLDFSTEKAFLTFISGKGEGLYEKEEPWFRWTTELSLSDLTAYVKENLGKWKEENPDHYKVIEGKNQIGQIQTISVKERSKGGIIKKLILQGKKGKLEITGEYQIRKALCPKQTVIVRQDGKEQQCSMLPSAFFSFECDKNRVAVLGGGYGHGVGLSQNGAKAMAELGFGYEEILDFYYPEVTLVYGY